MLLDSDDTTTAGDYNKNGIAAGENNNASRDTDTTIVEAVSGLEIELSAAVRRVASALTIASPFNKFSRQEWSQTNIYM